MKKELRRKEATAPRIEMAVFSLLPFPFFPSLFSPYLFMDPLLGNRDRICKGECSTAMIFHFPFPSSSFFSYFPLSCDIDIRHFRRIWKS